MKYNLIIIIFFCFIISCSNNTEISSEKICLNTCENNGESFCEGSKLYFCNLNKKNCLEKQLKQTCFDDEICRTGACVVSQCNDECFNEYETYCDDNNVVKCGNFDEDICYEKSVIQICFENQSCLNGQCIDIDLCENILCQSWQECNPSNGNCELKQGACDSENDCELGSYCIDNFCSNPCQSTDCNNGNCVIKQNQAVCECFIGYSGNYCNNCAENYQDNNNDESCLLACSSNSCMVNSVCDDSSGEIICTCNEFYYKNENTCLITGNNCNSEMTEITQSGEYEGDTSLNGVTNDFQSSEDCAANTNSKDIVFKLILTELSLVTAEIKENSNPPEFIDSVLYIKSGSCIDGDEIICNDDIEPPPGDNRNRMSKIQTKLEPGIYYIIVDGYVNNSGTEPSEGKFILDIDIIPYNPCDDIICENGGYCVIENNAGVCKYYNSCKELLQNGYFTDGIYKIQPYQNPIDVFCDMTYDGGGWTLIANVNQNTNAPIPGVNVLGSNYNSVQYSINAHGINFNEIALTFTELNQKAKFTLKNATTWNSGNSDIYFQLNNDRFAVFRRSVTTAMCCINSTNVECLNQNRSESFGVVSSGTGACYILNSSTNSGCGAWGQDPNRGSTIWTIQGGKIFLR